jgi:hypothetical protein
VKKVKKAKKAALVTICILVFSIVCGFTITMATHTDNGRPYGSVAPLDNGRPYGSVAPLDNSSVAPLDNGRPY